MGGPRMSFPGSGKETLDRDGTMGVWKEKDKGWGRKRCVETGSFRGLPWTPDRRKSSGGPRKIFEGR